MKIENVKYKWEILKIKETGFASIRFYPSGIILPVFLAPYQDSIEWNLQNFCHIPRVAKNNKGMRLTKKLKKLGYEWRFESEMVERTISNYRDFLNTYIKKDLRNSHKFYHVI